MTNARATVNALHTLRKRDIHAQSLKRYYEFTGTPRPLLPRAVTCISS